jgi:hypothetical protein
MVLKKEDRSSTKLSGEIVRLHCPLTECYHLLCVCVCVLCKASSYVDIFHSILVSTVFYFAKSV